MTWGELILFSFRTCYLEAWRPWSDTRLAVQLCNKYILSVLSHVHGNSTDVFYVASECITGLAVHTCPTFTAGAAVEGIEPRCSRSGATYDHIVVLSLSGMSYVLGHSQCRQSWASTGCSCQEVSVVLYSRCSRHCTTSQS